MGFECTFLVDGTLIGLLLFGLIFGWIASVLSDQCRVRQSDVHSSRIRADFGPTPIQLQLDSSQSWISASVASNFSCSCLSFLKKIRWDSPSKEFHVPPSDSVAARLHVESAVGSLILGGHVAGSEDANSADFKRAGGLDNLKSFAALLGSYLDCKDAIETLNAYGGQHSCLLRFLCARDGNLQAASTMFKHTVEWRSEQRIRSFWHLSETDMRWQVVAKIRPWWAGEFVGCTRDGSPIQVHSVRSLRPEKLLGFGEDSLRVFYLWWMEACLGLQRRGHQNIAYQGTMPKCIEIYDLRGVSARDVPKAIRGLQTFARALSVGQEHYPENLRKAFVINAPRWLATVWNICLRAVDANTRAKVSITADTNVKELSEYINSDEIETILTQGITTIEKGLLGPKGTTIAHKIKI